MMLNQLRIVRWLETSIIIVLPILLQKKRVKPKKAWSSWLSLLFHAFFASEKPGKDRKARKFLALLKSLHRSSKKAWRTKILSWLLGGKAWNFITEWTARIAKKARMNEPFQRFRWKAEGTHSCRNFKNSQEIQEWLFLI